MKTRSWTRVLSTLLTVAMIATLLVVPAAAAETKQTYNFSTDTSSSFFTITATDSDYRSFKTAGTIGGVTYSKGLILAQDSASAPTSGIVKFSGAGTLRVLLAKKQDSVVAVSGKKVHIDGVATENRYTSGTDGWVSATLGAGNHTLWARDQIVVLALEFTPTAPAVKYKATVATGITGGTVTLKVGEAAAAAEVEAAEGTVVNIVTEPASGNKVTENSIAVTKTDNSAVTLEADGKSFKMPAGAVTVTAAFETDSRSENEIITEVKTAVLAAVSGLTATQAEVKTEAEAKTFVENKIAGVDKQGCTVTVTISEFQAAVTGDDAEPEGTKGFFTYSIAVKKSESGTTETINPTPVTITATPKMYKRSDLTKAISDLKAEMKKYGAGEKADVFTGKIIVPADVMQALYTALAKGVELDNGKPNDDGATTPTYTQENSDKIRAMKTELETATNTFKEAVKNLSETGTKTAADPGVKVLTGTAALAVAAADTTNWTVAKNTDDSVKSATAKADGKSIKVADYFTFTAKKDDAMDPSGSGVYTDGLEEPVRIKLTKGGNISFTVAENATASVKVWWVSNANAMTLTSANGGTATPAQGSVSSGVTKNMSAIAAWDVTAGTYTLGGKNYVFRVEVKETGPAAGAAPVFADNGGDTYQVTKADVAAGTVSFTLADNAPAGAIYKLYTLNGGTYTQINVSTNGVTADANKKITFTLDNDHKGLLTGATAGTTFYYVSSTETDKGESDKTKVTVKRYVPVTGVKLTHFTATEPGSGVAGTVDHVLYEKLKSTDADVLGGAENPNVKYPNGWVLKAIVEPADATDKSVVFSNARVTPEFINVEEDGTVTVIKAGTGRVRVTSVSEPDVTAAFDLTVKVRIGAVEIQNADGTAAATTVAMGKTLPLKAVVTASASASQSHQEVTWNTSDGTVATVSAAGVVTPVKPGEVTITATSAQDGEVKDELTLNVTKGTPALSFTTGNPQVTSGGKVRFKLTGVPAGVTPAFTVKLGNDTKDVTVYELANDTDYNYYADMPANETGATVTYTVTAKVDGNDSWNAAEKSVEVKVLDVNAKNIYIVSPGTAKDVELTQGSAKLEVIAQVNKAGGVKDDAATAALTYKWTKDGEAMSDTTYAITVDTAGVYVCTVTSADAAVETKEATVTFTVTAPVSALTDIDVTPATGVDYTAATGALKITGPVDATFTVTTTPAEGHGDTLVAVSSTPSVARVSLVDGKLTITPWSTGETTITIRGTAAADVKKEIKVTVVKAAAPAALTTDDYTVTQPTVVGGKGTIKITQNAPEGTEYVYRKGDSGAWIKFPANKTIEVEPGVYKIRVYVPKPELQETTNGVAVEIKEFTAAPTVASVAVTSTADSLEEGKTLQLTAQVHMSNNTVSATETVTWTTSDATVATVSATGLVTGVKAGTVTITATSVTDNTKAGSKTLTVTAKQGGGDEPTPPTPVDKTALKDAIIAAQQLAAATYTVADDTKVTQVTKGTQFVTESAQAKLAAAIAAAKAVADKADATEQDVADALKALSDAMKEFNDAIQTGTKRTSSGSFGGGGGSATGTTGNTTTVTNPAGGKTTVRKDHEGNVTITATDSKGDVIAEVKLPATVPGVGYKFVDVPAGHWAEKAINEMAGLALVKGVDEAEHIFDMTSPITRGAVATILSRLANGKADVDDTFSDVAKGQWFAEGVAWAAKAGVVTGFEDGTFGPDGSITREQLAVMIARYAKLLGLDTSAALGELAVFTDADNVQPWAREGVAWCVKVGILQGRGDNTVDPGANATRAEATVMLDRLVNLMK